MNLIAISSKVRNHYDLEIPNLEILTVDCSQSKTIFEDVARCGIAIEKHLIVDGKTILWTDTPKYYTASVIWDCQNKDNFLATLEQWAKPRGDEIIFDNLHLEHVRGWAVGNPRSIIKWAGCALDLDTLVGSIFPDGPVRDSFTFPTSRLVWLAHRMGLKVYGSRAV